MRKRSKTETPVSIYVHIPFCASKCPYCAFFSIVPESGDIARFFDSLSLEISALQASAGTRLDVATLYIGGGTPTIIPPEQWRELLSILESSLSFSSCAEVSVEANPGSLVAEHLDIWKRWRVNRISLGVQSLNNSELRTLGRTHDHRQAVSAMEKVKKAGFALSADLLFGIPGQDLRSWNRSLEGVLLTGVDHLSIYQLTLETGTPWGERSPGNLPEGYPLYRWAQYLLQRRGFVQYEVASFARSGRWCRHNMSYWLQKNVMGLGPSAWGYLDGVRMKNSANLDDYCIRLKNGESPVCFSEKLVGNDLESEAAILALRTRWGIRFQRYRNRFGEERLEAMRKKLDEIPQHLLVRTKAGASLSKEGMRVGNSVWEFFLP